MSEIAIFSTSFDQPTYGPVASKLHERGYETWVYKADKVLSGEDELTVRVNDEGFGLVYNGVSRVLSDTGCAWFRHPEVYGLNYPDKAKQMSIEQETSNLQESFWRQVPDEAWLNHPRQMQKAQAKLSQLVLAQELGFHVPATVVSSSWEEIDNLSSSKEFEDIIVKMPRGVLHDSDGVRVLYATRLNKERRVSLQENNPFPAFYQEYMTKAREWRLTVVGDDAFGAAIYTTEDAKDDWRRHQFGSGVRFEKDELPDKEIDRCIKYLRHFNLLYGAFDFVEDHEGVLTFLECNTNGQYRWLEDLLGLPISDAIVSQLVTKHESNK
ncbi:MAG: hypothetical protein U5L95_04025 [Candidatus Saccharibacteria bacterium]|nr:hypothetical protein [Candidatus Saccharibacteria bacterium]